MVPRVDFFSAMASSDEGVSTPKRGQGKKIPLRPRTRRNPYPEEYDYTRELQYFSDDEGDDSMRVEEDEEGRLVMLVVVMVVANTMLVMMVIVMFMMMILVMMGLMWGMQRMFYLKKNCKKVKENKGVSACEGLFMGE